MTCFGMESFSDVLILVGWWGAGGGSGETAQVLNSVQSGFQEWICLDSGTCYHTGKEIADQICYISQLQYTVYNQS